VSDLTYPCIAVLKGVFLFLCVLCELIYVRREQEKRFV
jgi:hypothetical protein